jgi:signal transduction histidine kinase/CheY-like chemotaxis protein
MNVNAHDPSLAEVEASPLSHEERARVLSAVRLKLTLTLFVVALLVAFSAMTYVGVSRIFDWLTPSIRHDLQRKAQRGALELTQSAQLGMVLRDAKAIGAAAHDYVADGDVVSLVVVDSAGQRLFGHGRKELALEALFARRAGAAHDLGSVYAAWAPSRIEDVEVGRVALTVSKARLEAGIQLRREILTTAAALCLVALLLCLLFVNLYIGPILRMTYEAFVRLERTTEAALQAARLKSQFLANMSHEIRTPMNGIVGVLDLLNRTALNAKQQRYTQTIENSARSLLTIIDEVLDFSKLEAGKYVLREDDFEVRQVVQDVAELLAPKAHGKGIELIQRVERDVPYSVHADVDRVKQVVTNLIGNAIKFTERGHVLLLVSVEPEGEQGMRLRFTVQDTGLGIAREDQTKLFAVFSQVDGSMTRQHGGTGLGLAICKRLAEAMGGAVGVESEPGKGSSFWFTIATRPGQLTPPGDEMQPRDARVLVVAKSDAQRENTCELVSRWGMRFAATDSAEQAYALIMDSDPHPFDVAVVDGAFDAFEAASQSLFELCAAEDLPVLRLLSTAQSATGRSAFERELCLTKPVRVSELYNGLLSLIDGVPLVQKRGRDEAGDPLSSVPARNATVLVVDDNEINRLVAVEMLSELGYGSDLACNGVEALAKLKHGIRYGAILMDCQMPEMDGYEATRCIRELPGPERSTPIIALTAHAMAGDRDRVLRAGMDDYAAKPVRARALERVLLRWVKLEAAGGDGEQASVGSTSATQVGAGARPLGDALPRVELDPTIPRSAPVIELFLRSVPEQMEALARAATSSDVEQVRSVAHKLKGGCLSLGASRMAAACQAVEQAAAQGHIDTATLSSLPALYAAVAAQLDKPRTSGPAPTSAPTQA